MHISATSNPDKMYYTFWSERIVMNREKNESSGYCHWQICRACVHCECGRQQTGCTPVKYLSIVLYTLLKEDTVHAWDLSSSNNYIPLLKTGKLRVGITNSLIITHSYYAVALTFLILPSSVLSPPHLHACTAVTLSFPFHRAPTYKPQTHVTYLGQSGARIVQKACLAWALPCWLRKDATTQFF